MCRLAAERFAGGVRTFDLKASDKQLGERKSKEHGTGVACKGCGNGFQNTGILAGGLIDPAVLSRGLMEVQVCAFGRSACSAPTGLSDASRLT